jgi:hypothetical protein
MGKMSNVDTVLIVKLEGKKPLGKTKCRWKNNIRIDLEEIGYECVCVCVCCIYMAKVSDQWRVLVYLAINFQVSLKKRNFLTS